jgi:hypothetical protein
MSAETSSRENTPRFRLDVPLHGLLMCTGSLGDDGLDPPIRPPKRRCTTEHITRAFRCWAVPWLKSRVLTGDFHPIIAYLFSEWKWKLDLNTVGLSTIVSME